jgi:hypothetical protein
MGAVCPTRGSEREICLGLARRAEPRLTDRLAELPVPPQQPPAEQLRLATAITTRTLGTLA